ncbi:hypothetical protein CapIbe_007894 [Capra ibex]
MKKPSDEVGLGFRLAARYQRPQVRTTQLILSTSTAMRKSLHSRVKFSRGEESCYPSMCQWHLEPKATGEFY